MFVPCSVLKYIDHYCIRLQILYPNMKIADMMSKIVEPAPVMSGINSDHLYENFSTFNTCCVLHLSTIYH